MLASPMTSKEHSDRYILEKRQRALQRGRNEQVVHESIVDGLRLGLAMIDNCRGTLVCRESPRKSPIASQ